MGVEWDLLKGPGRAVKVLFLLLVSLGPYNSQSGGETANNYQKFVISLAFFFIHFFLH